MRVVAERGVISGRASLASVGRELGVRDGGWVCSMKPGREPSGGEIASENDDMSSDKGGERPPRRKSKGSCLKLI